MGEFLSKNLRFPRRRSDIKLLDLFHAGRARAAVFAREVAIALGEFRDPREISESETAREKM